MLRNIGSNWILNVVRIAVLMHLTPYVIGALGQDVNGVWVAIVSLTGFLKLLILGVPMASVRFLAEHLAKKDDRKANEAVSTCLGICVFLGACAAVIGGALYFAFDGLLLDNPRWQELGGEVLASARLAYLLVVGQIAFGFALRLPYGIFDAHHDFVTRNYVMAGELLLRYGLTLGLLALNTSLVVLAVVQILCMVAEFVALIAIIRVRYPRIRFGLKAFEGGQIRAILGFSVFTLFLNVGAMLAFRSDALVIGTFMGATEVTRFDVANKFFEPLTELVIGIAVVVMPTATRLAALGDRTELTSILLRWSKVAFSIVLVVGVFLLVLGPEFLEWWLGDDYHPSSGPVLQVLTLSFLVYLPVRGVALPILLGLGKPGRAALGLLAMGAVNLATSIALVGPLGILGVALGTAVPNVIFAVIVAWLACAELGASRRAYALHVFGRGTLGALVPIGLLLALKYGLGVHGFVPLFAAGISSSLVFAAVWVLFVYRNDPHTDLLAKLRAARGVRAVTALLVALLGLVGVLVAAELGLRLALHVRDRWYVWTPHQRTRMHLDPAALPMLKPEVRIAFNRDGERGSEPPRDARDCFRVLVAGGSAAEGYYLDQDDNWPQVIQALLSEPASLDRLGARNAHVGNISRSLVPCEAIERILERVLPRYESLDVVVFFVGASDVVHWLERGTPERLADGTIPEAQMFAQTPRVPWSLQRRDLALWRVASQLYRARARPVQERHDVGRQLVALRAMRANARYMIDEVPDPAPLLDYFGRHFRAMLQVAQRHARRVVVVRQPWFDREPSPAEAAGFWNFGLGRPRSEPVDTYYTHRVVAQLMGAIDREAARLSVEAGVEQLDALAQLDLDLDTFYDYLHYTPAGSRHLAEIITAHLLADADRTAGEAVGQRPSLLEAPHASRRPKLGA